MTDVNRPFYPELHAFRGIAILSVIAVHIWSGFYREAGPDIVWDPSHQIFQYIAEILWHDTTLFFAFISGLLFSSVLVGKGWLKFFKSKALNVLVPYLFMTLVFTYIDVNRGVLGAPALFDGPVDFFNKFILNALRGTAVFAYWYIPVLACLYLLTPFIFWLLKNSQKSIFFLAVLPFIFTRTAHYFSFYSVTYFLGVYSLGMYLGLDYENKIRKIVPFTPALIAISVTASGLIFFLMANNIDRIRFVSVQESIFYIQKVAFIGLLLIVLRQRKKKFPEWLSMMATYAFALYFLHFIFIRPVRALLIDIIPLPSPLWLIILAGLVVYILATILCLAFCVLIKRLFGNNSRMLMGA